jgi:hypothetical protein
MIDQNLIHQTGARYNELIAHANKPVQKSRAYPTPNLFNRLFAALKPAKRTQPSKERGTAAQASLATE